MTFFFVKEKSKEIETDFLEEHKQPSKKIIVYEAN